MVEAQQTSVYVGADSPVLTTPRMGPSRSLRPVSPAFLKDYFYTPSSEVKGGHMVEAKAPGQSLARSVLQRKNRFSWHFAARGFWPKLIEPVTEAGVGVGNSKLRMAIGPQGGSGLGLGPFPLAYLISCEEYRGC